MPIAHFLAGLPPSKQALVGVVAAAINILSVFERPAWAERGAQGGGRNKDQTGNMRENQWTRNGKRGDARPASARHREQEIKAAENAPCVAGLKTCAAAVLIAHVEAGRVPR